MSRILRVGKVESGANHHLESRPKVRQAAERFELVCDTRCAQIINQRCEMECQNCRLNNYASS